MLPLDAQTLYAIAPRFSGKMHDDQKRICDALGPELTSVMSVFKIDTPLRIAHFLGQCCEESAGFRALEEFASGDAYEGRRDLGNVQVGDGRRYKGRGIVMVTGRDNYASLGRDLGLDLIAHPELLSEPHTALLTACKFWTNHSLNDLADGDDLIGITRAINGGLNGLADRRAYTSAAKNAVARIQATLLHGKQDLVGGQDRPVLHRGAQGSDVEILQTWLSRLGYEIAVDQDFGPGTEQVVRQFQAHMYPGAEPDGIVGAETWAALDKELTSLGEQGGPT